MEKIIFASDLDRTLIYSHRMLPAQGTVELYRPVEWLTDRYISYMTQDALSKLREISRQVLFIPATTRTKHQYQRINLQEYGIVHQYAIASNGGTIFDHGREDKDWYRHISIAKDECLAYEDLLRRFSEIAHPCWVIPDSGKFADDLFYCCLINRSKIPPAELASFKLWARENKWDLSVQGRKLYLVPRNINKQGAIQYIRKKENLNYVAASGDSFLDLGMLQDASLAIAPRHGEIFMSYLQGGLRSDGIKFTAQDGIQAAEEIIDIVGLTLTG